jgi:hypothetical protein
LDRNPSGHDAEKQHPVNAYFRAIAEPVVALATTNRQSVRVAGRKLAICLTIQA